MIDPIWVGHKMGFRTVDKVPECRHHQHPKLYKVSLNKKPWFKHCNGAAHSRNFLFFFGNYGNYVL